MGLPDGLMVGLCVDCSGLTVGELEGELDGDAVGIFVGKDVGVKDGRLIGMSVCNLV